jgi:hypothetical protein
LVVFYPNPVAILLFVVAGILYVIGLVLATQKTIVVSRCRKTIKDLESKHQEEKWKITERRKEVEMLRERLGGKYFRYEGVLFPINVASQYWTFVDIEDAFYLEREPICPECKNLLKADSDYSDVSDYKCINCEFEVENLPALETLYTAAERQMRVDIENYAENKRDQKPPESPAKSS